MGKEGVLHALHSIREGYRVHRGRNNIGWGAVTLSGLAAFNELAKGRLETALALDAVGGTLLTAILVDSFIEGRKITRNKRRKNE